MSSLAGTISAQDFVDGRLDVMELLDRGGYDRRFSVRSESKPDVWYVVALKFESWLCSCPRWTKSKYRRQECKHIAKARTYHESHPVMRAVAPKVTGVSARERRERRGLERLAEGLTVPVDKGLVLVNVMEAVKDG